MEPLDEDDRAEEVDDLDIDGFAKPTDAEWAQFHEFLGADESEQIDFIDHPETDENTLLRLHANYLRYAVANTDMDARHIWQRILERLNPEEFLEAAQDARIRRKLEKHALKTMRDETYENQIRPLLHDPVPVQDTFLASLRRDDLAALLKLLDRYAREYGRSERCRDVENRIRARLEDRR